MVVKRKYKKKVKKLTLKDHLFQVWGLFVWAKNNPWVFAILIAFYGSAATALATCTIKLATPIVGPIIDERWSKSVAPYDTALLFLMSVDSLLELRDSLFQHQIDSLKGLH